MPKHVCLAPTTVQDLKVRSRLEKLVDCRHDENFSGSATADMKSCWSMCSGRLCSAPRSVRELDALCSRDPPRYADRFFEAWQRSLPSLHAHF